MRTPGTPVALLAWSLLLTQATVAVNANAGQVRVTIDGFDGDYGNALVALFISAEGFPDEGMKALYRRETAIRNGSAEVVFTNVPVGSYAISVLHDADGDYEMDTDLLGRPAEGYGVSRDATRLFGPPRFADCALQLAANEQAHVTIRIH